MKKALKHLPTIVLLAFIFVMAILFFSLPKKEYSSSEKRYLSDFPTLTVDTFFSGDFGEEFEKFACQTVVVRIDPDVVTGKSNSKE